MAHGQHLCSQNALAAVLSQHGRTATCCIAEGVCIQVHSGEFVQIVHVRNNHWCVVSTVGCESGAVYVYDRLYKSPTKELIHLIASMIHSQSNELNYVDGCREDLPNTSLGMSMMSRSSPMARTVVFWP